MLLVRGGYSTLVGGLVAMGHGVPIVALAAFGGAASKVWESLSAEHGLATREESSFRRGRSGLRIPQSVALRSCLHNGSGKKGSANEDEWSCGRPARFRAPCRSEPPFGRKPRCHRRSPGLATLDAEAKQNIVVSPSASERVQVIFHRIVVKKFLA
jgi:hypothetical protein